MATTNMLGAVPVNRLPPSMQSRSRLRNSSQQYRTLLGAWNRVSALRYGTTACRRCRQKRRVAVAAPKCCWSLEVSLATSAFVAATTTLLVCRNSPRDRGNAVFLGVFGSMQLIDALLWWEQGSGMGLEACSMLNRIVTRAGIGIILLEPIAALIGTSMIAKRKPSLLEVMLYSTLFLFTPMAGTTYAPGLPTPVPCHAVVNGACDASRFPTHWGNMLFDIQAPCVCTSETPQGHLRYGGLDVLYHSLHTPLDDVRSCDVTSLDGPSVTIRGSDEIPMVLRLAFLLSMAVPYATKVKPTSCGASHAAILLATWMYGAMSDAHASMWCVANVIQGALMLADPYLWPTEQDTEDTNGPVVRDAVSWRPARGRVPSNPVVTVKAKPRAMHVMNSDHTQNSDERSTGESSKPKTRHQFYKKSRVPENLDAIVIGSGIGGLACASLLAKAGKRVLVLEKHYRPGGCTHAFTEVGDNAFDSGIHYIGGGPVMTGLLEHVVQEPIELAQMGSEQDGYLYDRFDLGAGPENMIDFRAGRDVLVDDLVERYPHEEAGIKAYMAAVKRSAVGTNALMLSKFVPPAMPGGKFIRGLLASLAQRYGRHTASVVVSKYVKDPELQALLAGGQLIDWNLSPGKVSWLVSAGMMNYYADGGFYPVGGSNRIPERIIPIIEGAGGAVLCKASVEQVVIDNTTGRCVGVRMANGDELNAPIVVSGVGYENTFEKLLPQDALLQVGLDVSKGPSSTMKPSHGHMCAFISLDGPPESFQLKPWNIHSMPELPRYNHDIDRMQDEFYEDPLNAQEECLMTLTCPSAKDPLYGEQFPGRSNVLLLVEGMHEWFSHLSDAQASASTHGHRSPDYKTLKQQFEDMFLERLYKYYPLTRGHVTHVELSTPLTAEHFLNAPKGASYGLEWTPAHFEPQMHEDWFNPTTKIPGLFLTGEAACFGGFYGALATGYATASHVVGLAALMWLLMNDKPVKPMNDQTPRKCRPRDRRHVASKRPGFA